MSETEKTWLMTLQEAQMACRLLFALEIKRKRDGPEHVWLTHYQATCEVLSDFEIGAARHFIEKMKDKGAFTYLTNFEGKKDKRVFRFTFDGEQRIRDQLLR